MRSTVPRIPGPVLDSIQQGWRKPNLASVLLYPLSLLYRLVMALRHAGYRMGIFRSSQLGVPVIVIGGISVGGSGKTPLVIAMVQFLKEQGYSPGVLSRGYGGQSDFWPRQVDKSTTADLVGDEPQLIFERCDVPVVVGPDRVQSGSRLIDAFGCDVLVSDDGFQHFALRREMDVVVIDEESGTANHWCLPAGPLREPISSLDRAHVIVANGNLDRTCRKGKGVLGMQVHVHDAKNLATGLVRALSTFRGGPVHAVAGVGNPQRFFQALKGAGLTVEEHAFPDHHQYAPEDFCFDPVQEILMTEKDAIKCREMKNREKMWAVPAYLHADPEIFEKVRERLGLDR